MKLLQYQEQVSGIPSSLAPERTTPDKWQPNTNTPQSNWQKAALYSVAAIMPFVAFVNLGQPERSTADKWQPEANRPVFDVKRTQQVYPTFFVDGKQFTISERITPDKWQPETNKPLFDVKRQQGTYPSFFFNPLPIEEPAHIQMAGIYQTPVPYLTVKHTEYLFPPFVIDPNSLTQKEVAKVFSSESIVLSFPRNTQYQGLTYLNKPAVTEIVTLDKWNHDTDRPTPDAKRQQYLYPFESQNILPIEETADIQDAGIYQTNVPYFPTKHAEYLYQSFGIDPTQLTQHERITVNKWFKETEHTLWDKARTQHLYPGLSFNPFPLPPTEVVTTDKWFKETQLPRFDVKRQQYLYPSFVIDALSVTRPEVPKVFTQETSILVYPRLTQYQSVAFISLGTSAQETPKIFSPQSIVLSFPRTTQYQALAFLNLGRLAEIITLGKWYRPTEQPFFIPHNHNYIPYVFEPRRKLPTRYDDKYTPRNTAYDDKYTSRNTAYGDKYSSRGSNYSDKYSSQGSAYSDKYSPRNTDYKDKYPKT